LPELLASALQARAMAGDLLTVFRQGLLEHHEDEERELFPAVQAAAQEGAESAAIDGMVAQLVREHRAVEALWNLIEPAVNAIAEGGAPALDPLLLQEIVQHFFAHVHYEEQEFLPLAQRILSREGNEMAELAKALHTRHERYGR
jgi:hemerythrin-like domain-containing protein